MKLKLSQVVGSVESLKALLETKVPAKTAYWLSKLINNQIERELKAFNVARDNLIKEHGTEDEDKSVSVKEGKMGEYNEKLVELLETEIEVEWNPLKIEDLGDIKIEPKNLVSWLFE